MFDIVFIVVAFATGGGGQPDGPVVLAETLTLDAPTAVAGGSSEAPPDYAAPVQDAPEALPYEAEPQVQTGRFLTALEVKPILGATRANWIGVREWEGKDLVYVTQLWAWRCGLVAIRGAINDAALEDWALPACHEDTAQPNAILAEDGLPYLSYPLKSVETVTVEVIYDDLTTEKATFNRLGVLMP